MPVDITLDSVDRIYRNDTVGELLYIALHGDYKYGELKNTTTELDTQNGIFIEALIHETTNHDMIVMGYSGRDKSFNDPLLTLYFKNKVLANCFGVDMGQNHIQRLKN